MPLEADRPWSLTGPALERLLQRLGGAPEQAAREYEVVRGRLIGFFRRRGVPPAEALADETIDRVARRLDAGQVVEHLNAYFYGVAKRALLEWRRRRGRERGAEREYARPGPADAAAEREARVACLERCVGALDEASRALLAGYYPGGADERKRLAESHGITYTALKTRVFRLRIRLEECLRQCLEARSRVTDAGPATPGTRRS